MDAEVHLRSLDRHEQALVLDEVLRQLGSEPMVETRNRKPMRPNTVVPWELRIGRLCVYRDVRLAEHVVRVLAIGLKDRDVVRIGGEAMKL